VGTAQKSSDQEKLAALKVKLNGPTPHVINDNRRSNQIKNRAKYRLNKRRNLWVRSIAKAKDARKIEILQAKVEAFDLALEILAEA